MSNYNEIEKFLKKYCYIDTSIITTDIGNKGYYVKDCNNNYSYISKKHILRMVDSYIYNNRKSKLATLKILSLFDK